LQCGLSARQVTLAGNRKSWMIFILHFSEIDSRTASAERLELSMPATIKMLLHYFLSEPHKTRRVVSL
jgi:hypothetical protein